MTQRAWLIDVTQYPGLNRRRVLRLGFASVVAAALPGEGLHAQSSPQTCAPPIPQNHGVANGRVFPYPIPWLDKNRNHNQPAAPNVELSIARCNGFRGMGTDNKSDRLVWRTPTTTSATWRVSTGAGRQAHQAVFAHT
jgi:hypothetical protein